MDYNLPDRFTLFPITEPSLYRINALSAIGARMSTYNRGPVALPNSIRAKSNVHGRPRIIAIKLSPKSPCVAINPKQIRIYITDTVKPSFDFIIFYYLYL
jgi:hypothetical protein